MVNYDSNIRKLMYLLLQTKLMIESWHLFLTGISTCVVVFAFIWNFNRARKKDFKEAMETKADIKLVESEFKTHSERINNVKESLESHEKSNKDQFLVLKDIMAESHATQSHISERIDRILEMLTKKSL